MGYCARVLLVNLQGDDLTAYCAALAERRIFCVVETALNKAAVTEIDPDIIVLNLPDDPGDGGSDPIIDFVTTLDMTETGAGRVIIYSGGNAAVAAELSDQGALKTQMDSPAIFAKRIASIRRLVTMQLELECRGLTNTKFGITWVDTTDRDKRAGTAKSRVLWFAPGNGDADLREHFSDQLDITVASSYEAAMDFVSHEDVNACIIGSDVKIEDIESFIGDVRRYPHRFHLSLIWACPDYEKADVDGMLAIGLTECIPVDTLVSELLDRLGFLVRIDRRRERLQQGYRLAPDLAIRDSLTGLYNYGYFMEHVGQQVQQAVRREQFYSFSIISILNLDEINAAAGYMAGDRIIGQVGNMIGCLVRAEDMVGRLSGSSFGVSLPTTRHKEASVAIDRLASVIKFTALALEGGVDDLSVHLGVGCVGLDEGDELADLVKRANTEMLEEWQPQGNLA